MSDEQLVGWFDHERDEDGSPILKRDNGSGSVPSKRRIHNARCFTLGITEPADVERLWREKEAKRKAALPQSKKKKRRK